MGSPGLWTAPNSELAPSGAFKQAVGAVIKRPGLVQKPTPLVQYLNAVVTGNPTAFFQYSGRLYVQATGGLYGESGGSLNALTVPSGFTNGAASADTSDPCTTPTAEANGNLYAATADGILKFDAVPMASPYRAGVPRPLDVSLTLVAAGSLLASGDQVGYRVVFGILDANANLVLGPPSGRVTTTGSAAQDVTVKAYLPTSIYSAANATSYFYQVYRTAKFTVDPGEEMRLVYQAYLTATDVSNKYVSFTDATSDGLRGTDLYTNPSQEGLASANYAPPIATDIALFKGTTFYANTKGKQRARIQMLGTPTVYTVSTAAGGFTKSGGSGVATFTGSPDLTGIPTDGTAYISITGATSAGNNGDYVITAVNTGAFTITYTNAGAVTEAGAAGARAVATRLTIGGTNYYASLVAENTSAPFRYVVTTAVSSQSTVLAASQSLVHVLNATHATVYAYYDSGPDDAAGKIMFEEQAIGGSQFTAGAAGNVYATKFSPTIPTASPLKSQNDTAVNRLCFSKPGQPEHVPLANYLDIGGRGASTVNDRGHAILRIIALRDALLVFKRDGLYRVTGDGSNWSVSTFDQTLCLVARPSVVAMLGAAYAITTRGAFRITESGVSRIDGPIAETIRSLVGVLYAVQDPPLGTPVLWASEIDSIIYAYFHVDQNGNFGNKAANRCLAYSIVTNAWTEMPVASANGTQWADVTNGNLDFYAFPAITLSGRMYRIYSNAPKTGFGTSGYGAIFAEDRVSQFEDSTIGGRKSGEPSPAHKYVYNVTAANAVAKTVTLGAYANFTPSAIQYLSDTESLYRVVSNVGSTYTLALVKGADNFLFASQGAWQWVPITTKVEWVTYTAGDESANKRFKEASILVDDASTLSSADVSFYTEATTTTLAASFTQANSPTPTGISTLTNLRCNVPAQMQHARRLSVVLSHSAPEFLFLRGIAYEFEATDGREVT